MQKELIKSILKYRMKLCNERRISHEKKWTGSSYDRLHKGYTITIQFRKTKRNRNLHVIQ